MSIRAVNRLALPALLALLLIAGRSASSTRRVLAQAPGKTVTYPAGWNLLALPLGTNIISDEGQPVAVPPAATDFSFYQLPLGPLTALYTWQPGDLQYETFRTNAGYGFWAYFTRTATVVLGNAGQNGPYSVSVPAGQSVMVGNPSGTRPATVSGADRVLTYTAGQGYQPATTLQPGQGAWVQSLRGATITVTPGG